MTTTTDRPALEPCERCKSPIEAGDLRCAVCSLPVPERAQPIAATVARILRCEECGAALAYDIDAGAPRCAFCGALAHEEQPHDPLERAEHYLPFRVTLADARAALKNWLRGLSWLRPADLDSQATVDSLQPLWWVGWTFDVDASVSFTADSDEGARRAAWAPHSGRRSVSMRGVLVSASRGLSHAEARRLGPYFDLESGARELPESPDPGRPATVEYFDVQRSAARELVTRAVEAHALELARAWVPGTRVRNVHVAVLPERLTTRRYAFPTYVLAYRYRGALYRALVHGQDDSVVIGRAPWSWAKIAAIAAALAGVAALVLWRLL